MKTINTLNDIIYYITTNCTPGNWNAVWLKLISNKYKYIINKNYNDKLPARHCLDTHKCT